MMPSPLIRHPTDTRHSRRLSAASAPACVGPSDWPAAATILVKKPAVHSVSPASTPTPSGKAIGSTVETI
jgi:hypothetical protein